MPTNEYLLLYGRDEKLNELRRMVLSGVGYKVESVTDLSAPNFSVRFSDVALLILCHTLSTEECVLALASAAMWWPRSKCLLLADGPGASQPFSGAEILDVTEGPRALIRSVAVLLGLSATSRMERAS